MVHWQQGAWITSAVNNESVTAALVLAESIRRTRSNFRITAITSLNVLPENRAKLRDAFDMVFLMDETCAPGADIIGAHGDVLAKVYSFMLMLFEKCVFVSANSLFLENADALFHQGQSKEKFMARVKSDGRFDLSFFSMKPEKNIYNEIWKSVQGDGKRITNKHLGMWFKNQGAVLKTGLLDGQDIAEFSVAQGKLLSEKTHAPIIHFVATRKEYGIGVEEIRLLGKLNLGRHENLIANKWLEIREVVCQTIPREEQSFAIMHNEDFFRHEPIAIVGMSCRYPGANTLEEFWKLLFDGAEGIREPPAFRWTKEQSLWVSQQDRKSQAGFLATTVDEFDAKFFGVSPKEAAYMDPQVRLLHEVLWESLENAGINPLTLYGTHTGIFTGSWMNDYKDIVAHSPEKDFFRTYMGNSIGAAAARLSFLLGLTGPSIATESGCSSAIVALDLAVKSLRHRETNLALAGGVNLLLHPFSSSMMEYVISPDGRCKTFDEKANGFGRAEGCGVLVLKRMSDALRNRDNIWALIRGSAVSQEGVSRSLGTPTVRCEALSMQLALEDAGVAPEQVSFVETHGTGTPVGDPMEVAAIAKAYYSPNRKEPLIIGSVKTNVGHTESCSGITGVMKAVLALQNELIPKHRNLETLNPEIFLDTIPAVVPLEPITWPKVQGQPRICGVSSFGITGTDGHVILQEAPSYELPKFTLGMERPRHIITISGKSDEALEKLLGEYQNLFLERAQNDATQPSIANLAYSANVGRAAFGQRAFLVAGDYQEAAKLIQENNYMKAEAKEGENTQLCFLFTGQGSQYPGMAKTLYETSPIFQINFDTCERTLQEMYNISIKAVLWNDMEQGKELGRTIYSQTSIFCVEYCLLKLWQSWGVKPDFVLGHSLGEFCAAVAAEILSFEDALKLVAERSRLIDQLPRGSMLVIKASKPEVEKLMKSVKTDFDMAAVNNPEQTVVAGDTNAINTFQEYLKANGIKSVVLDATHAFHSKHMDPMLEEYRKVAETISVKSTGSTIQYVSGMEGQVIEDLSQINANYWVRHTRERVNFVSASHALQQVGCKNFLEVGPQPVLSSFIMRNNETVTSSCLPSLRKGMNDWDSMLTSLGKLYLAGYPVDWKAFDEPYVRNTVTLPFHPFHRKSYWVESSPDNVSTIHPLIGSALKNATALNIFQNDLVLRSVPYLRDHCIGSRIVFPGAAFAEMCLSAGYCVANSLTEDFEEPARAIRLENFRIDAPLELVEGKNCRLQVVVDLPEISLQDNVQLSAAGYRIKVYHQNNNNGEETGKWIPHATAKFSPVANIKDCMTLWNPNRVSELISHGQPISVDMFYKKVEDHGLRFGESFRMIRQFWTVLQATTEMKTDEVVAELLLPMDWNKYVLHPLLIDAVFQTGILTQFNHSDTKLKVPVSIGELIRFPISENLKANDSVFYHAWYGTEGKYHLFVSTPSGIPLAYVTDVELIDTNVRTIESVLEQQSSSIPDSWEEVWRQVENQPFSVAITQQVDLTPVTSEITIPTTSYEDSLIHEQLDTLTSLYIVDAMFTLGWNPDKGDVIKDVIVLCKQLNIKPQFKQLVHFYLDILSQELGILERQGSWWLVAKPSPPKSERNEQIQVLTTQLKASKAKIVTDILERIAGKVAQILIGAEAALDLLFPQEADQSHFSVGNFYINYPGRHMIMNILDKTMRPVFFKYRELNPGKTFRILEVGSGTGHMSLDVLLNIQKEMGTGDHVEYYYTDISPSFFIKAEKKLEAFRHIVKYAVFNIEKSPLSQGIPINYFDVVFGTDVLHATRNLEETLSNLRQTLKPGGVLIFTDTVTQSRDITFVFGLLDGYWRFEDFDRRPNHCCINGDGWKEVISKCDYSPAFVGTVYSNTFAVIAANATESKSNSSGIIRCFSGETQSTKYWLTFAELSGFDTAIRLATMLCLSDYKVQIIFRQHEQDKLSEQQKLALQQPGITAKFVDTTEETLKNLVCTKTCHGVIYGWAMNLTINDQDSVSLPLLHVIQRILESENLMRLLILTPGLLPATDDHMTMNPTAGTLYGMVKTLVNENPNVFTRCVDLELGCDTGENVEQILYELAMCRGSKELFRPLVAYRNRVRFEPKLIFSSAGGQKEQLKLPPSTERYHLKLPETRLIQDLEFEPLEEGHVGERQFEVKVKAFALNFRDVFTVLKPSKEFERLNAVGLDFAGVVTRVGPNSAHQVGERIFGVLFKDALLPSHVVLDDNSVLRIPDKMTFSEAVTMPAVFLTAYHCLVTVAKLGKGDTVLIHTGSGGVGLAAIQVARMVNAEIITTAGNRRKRAYLRRMGIEHVFHSRDTSFEQDILRATNGRGVDVVLNSITGPGIKEATLRSLARNGRWVEMSKLSVWTPEEMKALRPDVNYRIEDLTQLDKQVCIDLLQKMSELQKLNKFEKLPSVSFDALHIRQAMSHLQKAKHIGKIVVNMPNVSLKNGQYETNALLFNSESTYLITGGLGGIGFEVCKWMVEQGARDLVLVGRRPAKPELEREIRALRQTGANITIKLGDIGSFKDCEAIINWIKINGQPLRGVMHCAGVLRDNMYSQQTKESFEATFNPKVVGTWNLHKLTLDCPLEHFVTYSSTAALIGPPGQANHAAANYFEDVFVNYRHSLGLAATSINWGQWAQVGVAKDINVAGLRPVSVKRMLNGLEKAMRLQKLQISYCEMESLPSLAILCPLLKGYVDERLWKRHSDSSKIGANLNSERFWKDMDAAESKADKAEVMKNYLKIILRAALRLEQDECVDENGNLQELGVDSLMMIELKNSVQSLLGSRLVLTVSMIKDCTTISLLANVVIDRLVDGENTKEEVPLEPLPVQELLDLIIKDSVLPDDISGLDSSLRPAVKASQISSIFVTGATGHLGSHLLQRLSKYYPAVKKIVCLVKGANLSASEARLQSVCKTLEIEESRVECVCGDVTEKNFGLSSDTYERISMESDAVFHCAAKIHPLEHIRPCLDTNKKRTDCRSVNIEGTLNVMRFSCTGKVKHVYYPSSLVTGAIRLGETPESMLSDEWPGNEELAAITGKSVPGIQSSRLVVEMLLNQANQRGIPCKVFRFPWLAGERETGRIAPDNLYILRFLSYLKAGIMPVNVIPGNFLPVDLCATLSLHLFFKDAAPCEIFNISHCKPQLEQEFTKVAKEEFGKTIELVDAEEFTERLQELSLKADGALKGQFEEQLLLSNYITDVVDFAKGYINSPDTYFTNEKVSNLIPEYGKEFPPTMDILRKDLQYLKGTGLLEKFGL